MTHKPNIFLKSLLAVAVVAISTMPISLKIKAAENSKPLTVVELFTSQGCSSCPPADALLETYVRRADVIALSYSVDYWDYLGWKDKFGSRENTNRQRAYARARGDRHVYTPQMVVNGISHMNGAKRDVINSQIARTNQILAKKKVALSVKRQGKKATVRLKAGSEAFKAPLHLRLVHVKKQATVPIGRGENTGRNITYHNIVLKSALAAKITSIKKDLSITLPYGGADVFFILLVQEGAFGPILGGAELK